MKKIGIIALLLLVCLLFMLPNAFAVDNQTIINSTDDDVCANEYYFDSNLEDDAGDGTIDSPYKILAPDRIKDNSIIHLTNGEYILQKTVTRSNLTVIGENPQKTVLSYVSNVGFTSNGAITLKNLTLLNLRVGVSQNSNFTAINTIFKDESDNSIIYSNKGGTIVHLDNCSFYDSHAQNGGAIYLSDGSLLINNSVFINNHARYDGGAIACHDEEIEIYDSKFISNYAANDAGGAIFLRDSNMIANNVEMINCSAVFGGAIISLSCNLELTNFTARNNKAKYYGGAVYKIYTRFELYNSTFTDNCAKNGGALYVDHVDDFKIFSNYFSGNHASSIAGAIFSSVNDFYYDSLFDEELNNSFYNNSAGYENDVYQSDSINLTIGNGNYILVNSDYSYDGPLPASYDLRELGYVTSVKNQGSNGNCWAFSSLGALESVILKATGTAYDLSEANMKNVMAFYSDYGWDMDPNAGGYDKMGIGYLTSWLGPVSETEDPYYIGGVLSPVLESFMHIQNILFLTRNNYTDNDVIKRAIMEHGAVSTSIYWESSSYRNGKNYYYPGTLGANHAVCIVGWDDTYSKSNFKNIPPGDGAWIIKNSWGTGSGDDGYYYVSYYDTRLAPIDKPMSTYTFVFNDTIKLDKNYQYDIPGFTDFFYNTTSTVWYKNIFTSTDDEYLTSVSTYFNMLSDWELSVYVNGVLNQTQEGKTQPGYYTINLNEFIPLNAGDVFDVVFKITVDGDAGVPISESISLNQELYSPNISFISYDGESWQDFYDLEWQYPDHTYYSQVACIKAFTILDKITPSIDLYVDNYNPVVITATVKNQYGYPVQSGTVTFNVEGKDIAVDVVGGVAKLTHLFKALDVYNISARYVNVGYEDAYSSVSALIYPDNVTIGLDISKSIVDARIDVRLSKSIDEQVYLNVNNDKYIVDVVKGKGSLELKDLDYGRYDVSAYVDVDYYYCENVTDSFTIDYLSTFIRADNLERYYNENYRYSIRLVDKYNAAIANKQVIFTVNNQEFESRTDDSGVAYLNYQFGCGEYEIGILSTAQGKYLKSSANKVVKVKSTISLPGTSYTYNAVYSAVLLDSNGKSLSYKEVTIKRGTVTRSYTTDANGKVSFAVDFAPGTYSIVITNPETNEALTQSIKVVKRITSNSDMTVYFGAGKSYTVRVYDDNGKIAKNVKVAFKVNNKYYYRFTDENGYASLVISLAPNSYKITATYKGYTVSNKITVKPTLIHAGKTVKRSKTFKYSVKLLNSNGKILKNKYVKVKFKGKTYRAKTNAKGIATFKIKVNSKVGKFTITSIYGSAKVSKTITVKR